MGIFSGGVERQAGYMDPTRLHAGPDVVADTTSGQASVGGKRRREEQQTIERFSLQIIDSFIFGDEVVELLIGILDSPDLILLVDEVTEK